MMLFRHETSRLALVVLVALGARLAFVLWWQTTRVDDPQQFVFSDSASYWELGQRLATGESYQFGTADRRVFRAPGYPLLLAGMFRVVGVDASPVWSRVLGAVLGALTVGAVFCLARLLFNGRVALLAGVIVALYPEAIATSTLPLADGPFCLWMLLQLILWTVASRARSSTSWLLAALAGILGGIATLTRPSWLLFTPIAVAIWWIGSRCGRRELVCGLAMLAGLTIAMMPWCVRNWHLTGRFVPTTLQVGASLYDGLNPEADGSSDMRFVPRFEEVQRAADAAQPPPATAGPFEYRLDRRMRDAALDWAAEHPVRAVELAAVKFLRIWNVWPNEPAFRNWPIRLAIFGTFVPVLVLSIVGAWKIRKHCLAIVLLLLPAAYFTALHMTFIGSLRYRQPAVLLLAILAAAAIELWWRHRTHDSARVASEPNDGPGADRLLPA